MIIIVMRIRNKTMIIIIIIVIMIRPPTWPPPGAPSTPATRASPSTTASSCRRITNKNQNDKDIINKLSINKQITTQNCININILKKAKKETQ